MVGMDIVNPRFASFQTKKKKKKTIIELGWILSFVFLSTSEKGWFLEQILNWLY